MKTTPIWRPPSAAKDIDEISSSIVVAVKKYEFTNS